ncbi:DUF3761 domain-containing protein [Streptomyces sp. NPDC002698]|uniref:DUF3761 domain-containing protein n=1 Tax=Streptomyces sp. NPDC002698 TaxID=3364660 RepID=UPI0036B532C2
MTETVSPGPAFACSLRQLSGFRENMRLGVVALVVRREPSAGTERTPGEPNHRCPDCARRGSGAHTPNTVTGVPTGSGSHGALSAGQRHQTQNRRPGSHEPGGDGSSSSVTGAGGSGNSSGSGSSSSAGGSDAAESDSSASSSSASSSGGSPQAPVGATALCGDGSYGYSAHRRGTCSHHGGVASWLVGALS